MADKEAPKEQKIDPEEPVYLEGPTGKTTKIRAKDYATGSYGDRTLVSDESADQAALKAYDRSQAEAQFGSAGAFAVGAVNEGAYLGIPSTALIAGADALGYSKQAEEYRRMFSGLQEMGSYEAGGYAGMTNAMLAGGELGVVGKMTGMGALGMAGSAAERMAARLLPESAGLLGSVARTSVRMAARGATEAGLIGLTHQLNQNAINNVPLTSQALAATAEGALFGGLLGGGLGAAGGLVSKAAEAAGTAVAGGGERGLARQMKRLGFTADEISVISSREGGLQEFLNRTRQEVGEAGVTWGGKTSEIAEAAGKKAKSWRALERASLAEADALGAAPELTRIRERMVTELASPYVGTHEYAGMVNTIRKLTNTLISEENRISRKLGGTATKFSNVENAAGFNLGGATANDNAYRLTFSDLGKVDDLLSQKFDRVVGRIHDPDAVRIFSRNTQTQMRDILRDEVRLAMEAVDPELAAAWGAQRTSRVFLEEVAAATSRKASAEFAAGAGQTFTAPDYATSAGILAQGNPASAAGLMAGKGIIRRVGNTIEPWMAERAWQNMQLADAGMATQKVKGRIKESLGKFFKGTGTVASSGYTRSRAKSRKTEFTREVFERDLERTRELLSEPHKQRVADMANFQSMALHPELGKQTLETYMRASEYLRYNIPPGREAKNMNSLRPFPKVHSMDLKEFQFKRISDGIKNPLSLLDGLEDGTISRDAVQAVKYVYPDLHSEIVQAATQEIWEMKEQGRWLPMDKIATLGIVLDSPVDSTLQPDFIAEVQRSFAPPGEPPQAPPPPAAFDTQSLQTPLESLG